MDMQKNLLSVAHDFKLLRADAKYGTLVLSSTLSAFDGCITISTFGTRKHLLQVCLRDYILVVMLLPPGIC